MEYKDGNNRTALSWAAEAGNKAIVKQLLEKGADPEAKDLNGQTPLFYAVGNIEVVKLLLEKGANPESKDRYGRTPLSRAVAHGYKEVVKLLMEIHTDDALTIAKDEFHDIRSRNRSKMHQRKRRQEQKRRKQERIDRTVYSAENQSETGLGPPSRL